MPARSLGTRPAQRQADVRGHNLALVLELVHRHGPVSRAQLTRASGLNRSTIAGLVAALAARGLVDEDATGCDRSTAGPGRPSHLVGARAGGPWVAAVRVDVGCLVLARIGLGGTVLSRSTAPLPASPDPMPALRAVARAVRRCGGTGCRPAGIGVSVPGPTLRRCRHLRAQPRVGRRAGGPAARRRAGERSPRSACPGRQRRRPRGAAPSTCGGPAAGSSSSSTCWATWG